MGFGWLWSLGRGRLIGLVVLLASCGGAGARLGMAMDRQGLAAIQRCTRLAGANLVAAEQTARCLGTVVVAVWNRRVGQLVPVSSAR